MSKIINCVIDTNSKKERNELVDFICKDNLAIEILNDYEGFQLILIKDDIIGNIGVVVANDLVNNKGFKHFLSVEEYINYVEGKELHNA